MSWFATAGYWRSTAGSPGRSFLRPVLRWMRLWDPRATVWLRNTGHRRPPWSSHASGRHTAGQSTQTRPGQFRNLLQSPFQPNCCPRFLSATAIAWTQPGRGVEQGQPFDSTGELLSNEPSSEPASTVGEFRIFRTKRHVPKGICACHWSRCCRPGLALLDCMDQGFVAACSLHLLKCRRLQGFLTIAPSVVVQHFRAKWLSFPCRRQPKVAVMHEGQQGIASHVDQ